MIKIHYDTNVRYPVRTEFDTSQLSELVSHDSPVI